MRSLIMVPIIVYGLVVKLIVPLGHVYVFLFTTKTLRLFVQKGSNPLSITALFECVDPLDTKTRYPVPTKSTILD